MQMWALIVDSLRHTLDRKIFWVMLAISVVIAAAMACIGFDETGVTVFFKWHFDDPAFQVGTAAQRSFATEILVYWLTDKYLGFVGVLVALVSTASIFPSVMESGTVDVVLAKPLSRTKLFVGKYFGCMTFVLLQSAVFVGLTFLVAGWRWKQWLWAYFWAVPLFVILFSYIYACCVFFAVWMRGSLGPLLLSLGCWVLFFGVQSTNSVVHVLPMVPQDSALVKVTSAARWAVPRTQDIPHIAARLIDPEIADKMLDRVSFDNMPAKDQEDMGRVMEGTKTVMSFDMAASLASSLGIEAIILILALGRFVRRDF